MPEALACRRVVMALRSNIDEWVRMDVKYMRRQSLWQDLSILFRTIPAVLLRKGRAFALLSTMPPDPSLN